MRHEGGAFPIVGIGASAGGLEALAELVGSIPEDSGFAYVVIQHLSPDHPSVMDQLLQSHAKIPVKQIDDGEAVRPDTVFVLPAGPWATLDGDTLKLHERDPERGLRTPIDKFLASLAEARGRSAFGVILSGTGSDGTLGVRAVKAAGGFALVQRSESARFPGMPDSAAATGLVDFALKPAKIPARLLDIARHRERVLTAKGPEALRGDIEAALPEILGAIADENGHDFSQYKPGTLVRRIERRMAVVREHDVSAFIDRLRRDADERGRLLQDFLIGVTRFFRDEDAFLTLRQDAILPLLDRDQTMFRAWVPGCATGEEAYSIAILLAEAMAAAGDHRQWQVFGTDIDTAALGHARLGLFTDSQLDGVSAARREAFFARTEDGWQVSPMLRERCIFAPHNLLGDPPFSRLDLISCRNLLIYLNAEVQGTVIPRFHYGLRSGGFLFLGPSETLGRQDRFFRALDRDARLFKRNDAEAPAFSSLALPSSGHTLRRERGLAKPPAVTMFATAEPSFEQQVLAFYARQSGAPFATVNANDEISYLSERMSRYVRPSQGQPSAALDQFLLRDLRLPVRSILEAVRRTGDAAVERNVIVDDGRDPQVVDLEAAPLPFAEGGVLVTLQPVRTEDAADLVGSAGQRDDAARDLVERELAMVRRQLAATLSSYETTEQELKSSNEELLSMNEELQSSNEELETSREELQSINEELETVNAELSENNRQLVAANSDLQNLFDSTDIATVFLDQALCVRRYTPASRRLFGIQDRDVGRPLSDLKWKVSYEDLEADAERVTASLLPVEREVRIAATEETFMMRIRPYRRIDDRIDGCVLTFVDITERKKAERQLALNAETLARQYAELETLYETTPVGLNLLDRDLRYLRINERLAEINGFPAEAHIGRRQDELVPDIDAKIRETQLGVLDTGEAALGLEVHGVTPAEPEVGRDWVVDYYPVRNADGEVFAVGSCVTEVTEQKRLQRAVEAAYAELAENRERLALFVRYAPAAIAMFDTEMTYIAASRRYLADYGLPADLELAGRNHYDIATDIPEHWIDIHRRVLAGETLGETEDALPRADGGVRWVSWRMTPWRRADGTIGGALLFSEVKTAEVEARHALEESEARLGFALETSRLGAWELDVVTGEAERTPLHDRIFGYEEKLDAWSFETFLTYVLEEDRAEVRGRFEEAVRQGETWHFQCRIRRADGVVRWIEAHGRPRKGERGNTVALMGTVQDITTRKEAEAQQSLLLHELQHRVKNTMATTLAIVQFSARRASDIESFSRTLGDRLRAIARTHDVLTATEWRGGRLRDVLMRELDPYADATSERVRVEGDDLVLPPKQMLALTLAFHELTTNAAKHGALSVPEGCVVVSVRTVDSEIVVRWVESGGPPVVAPAQADTGFGTLLLDRVLGPDLDGEVEIDFAPEGVRWRARFPLDP